MVGDGGIEVSKVASIHAAVDGDLVFIEDEENLDSALHSKASAVIAGDFAEGRETSKVLLIASHPRLAFARTGEFLRERTEPQAGVHPNAFVHQSAKLGASVSIDANATVHGEAAIGDHTWIGAGCVIGYGTKIGQDCNIYPNVTIYPGAKLGNRVIVHAGAVLASDGFGYVRDSASGRHEKFPQIGRLEIEDDVEIGANATIDRGALDVTRIGRGTKIDNLVHVGHNVQVGEDVVIAAQTGLSGSAVVKNNVVIGGQAGIADHVRIEEGVILGAQCGVPSNKVIRGKGVVFWGTPARPIREYLKQLAVLARLAKKE